MSLPSGTVLLVLSNSHLKSRLSLYLRELGKNVLSSPSLVQLAQRYGKELANLTVLLDDEILFAEAEGATLQSLIKDKGVRIIGVIDQEASAEDLDEEIWYEKGVETILSLSSHPSRSKDRLEAALKGRLEKNTSAKIARPKRQFTGLHRWQSNLLGRSKSLSQINDKTNTGSSPRHLFCHSAAGREFYQRLREIPTDAPMVMLGGLTGSEFELVARELQFLRFGDQQGPFLPIPEELTMENLVAWEKQYSKDSRNGVCYGGLPDELPHEKVQTLKKFAEYLQDLRNPSLTLVVGWEQDHDFRDLEQANLFKEWKKKHIFLTIPPLGERIEDIRALANTLIAQLRILHPFLVCRSFSESGYLFLEEYAEYHSWEGFCSLIRSAVATTSKPILGAKELEPFKDPSILVAHIIESKADEVYFP